MDTQECINKAIELHRQGDLDTAENVYRKVLADQPQNPDANHLLGVIHHQRGDNEGALELINKALAMRENHPQTHNNLGMVLKELGRDEEALKAFQKAIELQPEYAEAYNNLGTVYKKTECLDEAESAFQKAILLKPDYINALNNQGNLCQDKRDFVKALHWYGKALVLDPDYPLSHYNLGCALVPLGRLAEAEAALLKAISGAPTMVEVFNTLGRLYTLGFQYEKSFDILQQALTIKPESEEVCISLGNLYSSMERFDKAAYYLKKAVQSNPDSAEANNCLGEVNCFLNKMEEAHACIEKARKIRPENPEILCNLSTVYIAQGLFDKASAASKKAIELKPDCSRAFFQLALVNRGSETEELIYEMIKLLDNNSTVPMQQIQLYFGLAKLLEEKQEYARAFEYLRKGNRLKRKTFKYSLELQQEIVEKTCAIYDDRAMNRFAGKGFGDSVPVFIVGMPRSGSTLVEQIISAHPDVHGAGEIPLLADTVTDYLHVKSVSETIPPDISLQDKDFFELGKNYAEQLKRYAPDALRITNKMLGNYLNLGLIKLILPKAKIIHCRRNSIDTCLSIYKKLFARGHQYTYSLEELGEYYHLYFMIMEHWKMIMPDAFLDFSYEDLVQDQIKQTRRLVDYCGLEWYEGCLHPEQQSRPVHTASAVQVRQPVTSSSVGLWKHYEQWLSPLVERLQPFMEG